MDDFLLRALLAGLLAAAGAGPMGCFVVWRRMAYFGDTLAHAALLGVALGLALAVAPLAGVLAVSGAAAGIVAASQAQGRFAGDTVLGIMAHGALALGLVALAFMPGAQMNLHALLFGDVLAVGWADVALTGAGAALVLGGLALLWRPLLALTVSADLARAGGVRTGRTRLAYMLLLAVMVALAMQVVGILLVTSLLIMPAATARRFAATPEAMALLAALAGMLAVAGGLGLSLWLDVPSGPSMVVMALVLFLAAQGVAFAGGRRG